MAVLANDSGAYTYTAPDGTVWPTEQDYIDYIGQLDAGNLGGTVPTDTSLSNNLSQQQLAAYNNQVVQDSLAAGVPTSAIQSNLPAASQLGTQLFTNSYTQATGNGGGGGGTGSGGSGIDLSGLQTYAPYDLGNGKTKWDQVVAELQNQIDLENLRAQEQKYATDQASGNDLVKQLMSETGPKDVYQYLFNSRGLAAPRGYAPAPLPLTNGMLQAFKNAGVTDMSQIQQYLTGGGQPSASAYGVLGGLPAEFGPQNPSQPNYTPSIGVGYMQQSQAKPVGAPNVAPNGVNYIGDLSSTSNPPSSSKPLGSQPNNNPANWPTGPTGATIPITVDNKPPIPQQAPANPSVVGAGSIVPSPIPASAMPTPKPALPLDQQAPWLFQGASDGFNPQGLPATGNIPKYDNGGMVPGQQGQPVLAVVHAGEVIRNPQQEAELQQGRYSMPPATPGQTHFATGGLVMPHIGAGITYGQIPGFGSTVPSPFHLPALPNIPVMPPSTGPIQGYSGPGTVMYNANMQTATPHIGQPTPMPMIPNIGPTTPMPQITPRPNIGQPTPMPQIPSAQPVIGTPTPMPQITPPPVTGPVGAPTTTGGSGTGSSGGSGTTLGGSSGTPVGNPTGAGGTPPMDLSKLDPYTRALVDQNGRPIPPSAQQIADMPQSGLDAFNSYMGSVAGVNPQDIMDLSKRLFPVAGAPLAKDFK